MKRPINTTLLVLQFLLLCCSNSVSAALITFDDTTSSGTFISSPYSEGGYDFTFGKGMYYVDSAYSAWTGLSAFDGDALHFNTASSFASIRSSDGSAFSLVSLFAGTLRTSSNDQGYVYFDGLRSTGELVSTYIYAGNKAAEYLFTDLTDLVQLTIHRDILNFPVIDNLVLTAFQQPVFFTSALHAAKPMVTANEPSALLALLLGFSVLLLVRMPR
ncbi:hypothetical protein [Alteromonas flava]|uniref:hypothetical protein n=1 Tax=Alteromonas flava TaxID=2048003 RepID=UPI000F5E5D40|nr:hypothetical protein [Alteromonas flava]